MKVTKCPTRCAYGYTGTASEIEDIADDCWNVREVLISQAAFRINSELGNKVQNSMNLKTKRKDNKWNV